MVLVDINQSSPLLTFWIPDTDNLDFAPSCWTPDGHPVADLRLHDGPSHRGHPGHFAFIEIGLVHPDDDNGLLRSIILGVSYRSAKVDL